MNCKLYSIYYLINPIFPMILRWVKIMLVFWTSGPSMRLSLALCAGFLDVHSALLSPLHNWPHFCTTYEETVSWANLFEGPSNKSNCKLSSWHPVTKVRLPKATWSFISGCINIKQMPPQKYPSKSISILTWGFLKCISPVCHELGSQPGMPQYFVKSIK